MPFRPCVVIHSASFSHLKVYCTVCTLLEKWVIEFSIIYQFIVCDTYILYSVYVLYSVECSVIYNFSFSHQQQEHKFCKNSTWFSISVCSTVFALFLTHMLPALCSTVGWLDFCIDMRSGHVRVAQKYFSICLSSLALETFLHYVI